MYVLQLHMYVYISKCIDNYLKICTKLKRAALGKFNSVETQHLCEGNKKEGQGLYKPNLDVLIFVGRIYTSISKCFLNL